MSLSLFYLLASIPSRMAYETEVKLEPEELVIFMADASRKETASWHRGPNFPVNHSELCTAQELRIHWLSTPILYFLYAASGHMIAIV